MQEQSEFVYEGEAPPRGPPVGPATGPLPGPYKFSAAEMRVLRECNAESFYQRSLPLGTVLGLGTYAAMQSGHLKPNPRFGALPKVTLAVVLGYFLGKFSYQQACAEKLMALPDSYIGKLLRERRDGRAGFASSGAGAGAGTAMFGASPGDIYSDAGPGNALDLDTHRPDVYRPDSEENHNQLTPPTSTPKPAISYEELRRRNRGESAAAAAKVDPYRTEQTVPAAPPISPPRATNKYGDVME